MMDTGDVGVDEPPRTTYVWGFTGPLCPRSSGQDDGVALAGGAGVSARLAAVPSDGVVVVVVHVAVERLVIVFIAA